MYAVLQSYKVAFIASFASRYVQADVGVPWLPRPAKLKRPFASTLVSYSLIVTVTSARHSSDLAWPPATT